MRDQHQRGHGQQCLVGLVALFHRAADVDAVARGQLRLDVLEQRPDLLRHRHALLAVLHVGTHGDRHVAVAAPQHGLLELVTHLGHLRQRHHRPLAGVEVDVLEPVEVQAFVGHGAGHDVDQLLLLAQLRQGRAVHHGLRHHRDVGRREAERTRLVLVQLHLHRAHRVVPVELHVAHLRAGRDHLLHLAGDLAHHLRVGTDHAELHRVAHRRPELQARHAHPRLRELLVGCSHQARTHAFTRFQVLGHHDELGEAGVRQLGIQRQQEARRAGAGIGGEELDVLILGQHRLHLLHLLGGRLERGAFLHAQIDRPARGVSCSGRTAAAPASCRPAPAPARRTSHR